LRKSACLAPSNSSRVSGSETVRVRNTCRHDHCQKHLVVNTPRGWSQLPTGRPPASHQHRRERGFFIDNLLVRIHRCFWLTGLAPWEFEFLFPGSLISTFLEKELAPQPPSIRGPRGQNASKGEVTRDVDDRKGFTHTWGVQSAARELWAGECFPPAHLVYARVEG
jgi:hypothetical protein